MKNQNIIMDAAFDILMDISSKKEVALAGVVDKFKSDSEFAADVMVQAKELIDGVKRQLAV